MLVDLIGRYFTVGGGALRVYISEDEASQIDVCLVHINLKLHCRLQGSEGGVGEGEEEEEKTCGGGEKLMLSLTSLNSNRACGSKEEKRWSRGRHPQSFTSANHTKHPPPRPAGETPGRKEVWRTGGRYGGQEEAGGRIPHGNDSLCSSQVRKTRIFRLQ